MTRIFLFLTLTFSLVLIGCGASRPYLIYVPFSATTYPEVSRETVREYKSRLDLPGHYEEVGVIKLEGDFKKPDVVTAAAKHGANAIIYEVNNAILFRLLDNRPKEQESTNEKTI